MTRTNLAATGFDSQDLAALLGDGAHLVGHSYGAIAALLAAALRPKAVWSLTITEPPVFYLAKSNLLVESMIAAYGTIRTDVEPRAFLRSFLGSSTADLARRHFRRSLIRCRTH